MIEVRDLVYDYPGKRALAGVSLSVRPQSIAALVGPNGAGKTTLLRCLAALATPYSGTVTINGLDTCESPRAVHACLGYLADFYGLYDALTVERCLVFTARAHGLVPEQAQEAARRAAMRVGLDDRLRQTAATLSRGLRQRLAIAQAIVHEPKVLLLDEPAAGLDPQARRDLSHLLVSLKDGGMTLMVSSHILSELEDYSTDMIIMQDGQVVGGGAMKVHEDARPLLRVQLASAREDLSSFIAAQKDVELVDSDPVSALFRFSGGPMGRVGLLRLIMAQGFDVLVFAEAPRALEDKYFAEVRGHKP
jgi:ABC-2 type transport system ATP-binding protein